ncbi:hypothetical protein NMG60_11003205 [Bertholletia excelsa]
MKSPSAEPLLTSSIISPPLNAKPGSVNYTIGILEVYIHRARDIPSVCIYHDQDVYAKVSLSGDAKTAVSTRVVNKGGKNPVFEECLRLDVRTGDSCLKCEIWMLSKIRDYLEDQLLGFVEVPLCEVFSGHNGKVVAREFPLSSCDLVHSRAGSVQLSLIYTGASPEVLEIPRKVLNAEIPTSIPIELDKIEFPDPSTEMQNEMMLSEYLQVASAPSSVSFPIPGASDQDSNISSIQDRTEGGESQSVFFSEAETVQREIVDMYKKSMQQFTESLAKMKLPLDLDEGGDCDSGDVESGKRGPASKRAESPPRVFYGSRAFF